MYGDGDVPLTVFGVYLEADSALGDRVEVVVMRRTGRVVEQVVRAERPKELGHESALSVGVNDAHGRVWHRLALGVDRSSNGRDVALKAALARRVDAAASLFALR